MKRYFHISCIAFLLVLFSCTPVLRQEVMNSALRNVVLSNIQKNPELYRGKLFVMGGILVGTKGTSGGSLIEAIYVPVDSRGYLTGVGTTHMRFLALFPKDAGILDPLIFTRGREVTLAAEFLSLREGKIDDMEYTYPYLKIVELYLWPEKQDYYIYYEPYPYWGDYPYWGYRPYLRPYRW